MKSPLKIIKEGIIKNNLTMILDGYNALTGENLSVKLKPKVKPLIVEELDSIPESEDQNEEHNSPRVTQRRQLELHKFNNTFVDNGKEYKNNSWDQKYKIKKVTPRRSPAKKYSVNCDKCKKSFKIYAKYLPPKFDKDDISGYVCNNCISKPI